MLLHRIIPTGCSRLVARLGVPRFFSSVGGGGEKAMSRKDLAEIIAKEHDLSHAKAQRILGTIFDTIIETTSQGKPVSVSGFGSFGTLTSRARKGINPRTLEAITIPSTIRPKFRPFQGFKDAVNK